MDMYSWRMCLYLYTVQHSTTKMHRTWINALLPPYGLLDVWVCVEIRVRHVSVSTCCLMHQQTCTHCVCGRHGVLLCVYGCVGVCVGGWVRVCVCVCVCLCVCVCVCVCVCGAIPYPNFRVAAGFKKRTRNSSMPVPDRKVKRSMAVLCICVCVCYGVCMCVCVCANVVFEFVSVYKTDHTQRN
jgi:hypothetical protein